MFHQVAFNLKIICKIKTILAKVIPRLQAPAMAWGDLFLRANQAPSSFSLTCPKGVSAENDIENYIIVYGNIKYKIFIIVTLTFAIVTCWIIRSVNRRIIFLRIITKTHDYSEFHELYQMKLRWWVNQSATTNLSILYHRVSSFILSNEVSVLICFYFF